MRLARSVNRSVGNSTIAAKETISSLAGFNLDSNMSFVMKLSSAGRLAPMLRVAGYSVENSFVQTRGFRSTSQVQTRVTMNSWSSDILAGVGEKLEEGEVQPLTKLSPEVLTTPSPKVLRIGNEMLSLNMIESVQFMTIVQVVNFCMLLMTTFTHRRSIYYCPSESLQAAYRRSVWRSQCRWWWRWWWR